jgi:hypothetical protein
MLNRHPVALPFRTPAIPTHQDRKRSPTPMTSSEKVILHNVLWEDRREFIAAHQRIWVSALVVMSQIIELAW